LLPAGLYTLEFITHSHAHYETSLIGGTGTVPSTLQFSLEEVCTGDLDGDGSVDAADLGVLLGGWGVCRSS